MFCVVAETAASINVPASLTTFTVRSARISVFKSSIFMTSICGKESLDDGFHPVDPAVKFLVLHLVPRRFQRVLERSFGRRNLPPHFGVAAAQSARQKRAWR